MVWTGFSDRQTDQNEETHFCLDIISLITVALCSFTKNACIALCLIVVGLAHSRWSSFTVLVMAEWVSTNKSDLRTCNALLNYAQHSDQCVFFKGLTIVIGNGKLGERLRAVSGHQFTAEVTSSLDGILIALRTLAM